MVTSFYGAGDEARTRYLHLGKVALYRMSYTRRNIAYYSEISKNVKYYFAEIQNYFSVSTKFEMPWVFLGRNIAMRGQVWYDKYESRGKR